MPIMSADTNALCQEHANKLEQISVRLAVMEANIDEIKKLATALTVAKQYTYTELIKLCAVFISGGGLTAVFQAIFQ